ncbi:hydantoinase/oxoprolinase [Chloropicon primus]|uniref:Hydantoinase/oxoprolinase n=3 Tax=Chloropicon primus TaxID=1764295 RepID=A0A5B8MDW0_9CHLO|nr:hydantoinase/oxoprolinase [Chloropicon primus]UPQ97660.1 hydantoinase/oxoprolinase [Chloropicon primus]|eukprot:QDZ18451.1 hydantoinase/oxoprolinase [Chloropicon primus]
MAARLAVRRTRTGGTVQARTAGRQAVAPRVVAKRTQNKAEKTRASRVVSCAAFGRKGKAPASVRPKAGGRRDVLPVCKATDSKAEKLVGVDVGGTFTDVVYTDTATGITLTHKVPTTPDNPSRGVLTGILELCERHGIDKGEITRVLHGTTTATNAILEQDGCVTGMITTEGYRDVVHIGRHQRPENYSILQEVPWQDRVLVKRRNRLTVKERVAPPDGAILEDLDEEGVRVAAREFKRKGINAIAICFLFSYLNPEHEQRAAEIVKEEYPEAFITTSAGVSPMFREFERFTTALINTYIGPKVANYVDNLETGLINAGIGGDLHVMASNGGACTPLMVNEKPVLTVLSGPAAGILGAKWVGELSGSNNLITFDVGGTSADIGIITNGEYEMANARETEIAGYPLMVPQIDIHTIGAGGGSIAYKDAGGAFKVGPRSAGAVPGPACYSRGGTEPTVTDANVVLGRLVPDNFLGGEMSLDLESSKVAVSNLAEELGLSMEECAEGIITIANANMANAVSSRTVQKGVDPREYALVAFGGGGSMQAAEVAGMLNVSKVLVPPYPGLLSAAGLLVSDLKYDTTRTEFQTNNNVDVAKINRDFQSMEDELSAQLQKDGVDKKDAVFTRFGDLRYAGQGYELGVSFPLGEITEANMHEIWEEFHKAHEREFGHYFRDSTIELVNIKLTAVGITEKIQEPTYPEGKQEGALSTCTSLFRVNGKMESFETAIYDRWSIPVDQELEGPAIICQKDTTTLVPPNCTFKNFSNGCIEIDTTSLCNTDDMAEVDKVDPVTAAVVRGELENIAVEMGYKVERMAYSSIIRESRDFGTALVSANGDQLAESKQSTPLQSGPIPGYIRGIRKIMEERGEVFEEGDVIMHNDPYGGASHGPDIGFIVPVFYEGNLVGFSGCTAHHLDIGSLTPGSCGIVEAVDAYAEGLQFKAIKVISRGEKNIPVWHMLEDNIRTSDMVKGDMEAQIAAAQQGALKFRDLFKKWGTQTVEGSYGDLLSYSERVMRQAISELPDGEYSATTYIDGYQYADEPRYKDLPICVTLRVKGDEMEVDLTGTAKQLDKPINMPFSGTVDCAIWLTIRSILLDSTIHGFIPQNTGLIEPIKIYAPPGCLANPIFPAPTIARFCPGNQLADTVMKALAQAAPEKVSAGIGNLKVISFSGARPDDPSQYWVHMEIFEGAYGGRNGMDGMDAIDTLYANTRNNPIEDIESHLPLRVNKYELRENAAAPGQWRGGLGSVREFTYLADGGASVEGEGHKYKPWGFDGGSDGETASLQLTNAVGSTEDMYSKMSYKPAEKGSKFTAVGPAGGGYGNPLLRDPRKVLDDVLDEYITSETAEEQYGVVLVGSKSEGYTVDEGATAELRAKRGEAVNAV